MDADLLAVCRVMDFSEGGWTEPEQALPEQDQPVVPSGEAPFVKALGSDGLSPSHPQDWAAEVNQGSPLHRLLHPFSNTMAQHEQLLLESMECKFN